MKEERRKDEEGRKKGRAGEERKGKGKIEAFLLLLERSLLPGVKDGR